MQTKVGSVIVTSEIAHIGMRVGRGKDWCYVNQDIVNGCQVAGTIKAIATDAGSVIVDWDGGSKGMWYGTKEGQYHLSIWEEDRKADGGYLEFTSDIRVGDKLVFSRHLADSVSSGLTIGDIVTVTIIGSRRVCTDKSDSKCTGYFIDIGCFKRASSITVTPPKPALDISGYMRFDVREVVKEGDILIGMPDFSPSLYYYKETGIVPGKLYEVIDFSYDCDMLGRRGQAVKIKDTSGYWVDLRSFAMYKKATPQDLYEGLYLTPSKAKALNIRTGDRLIFRRHQGDSFSSYITIGEEVEVMNIHSKDSHVITNKRKDWWVPIECFTFSTKALPKVEEIREKMADEITYPKLPFSCVTTSPESKKKKGATMSSISSSIKTEDYVRRINVTGHVIKVRGSHLKIERGERIRGVVIQSRADKARISR